MLDKECGQPKAKHVSDFCLCGKSSMMESDAENICCKASRFCVKMPTDSCVTEHCDFNTIINKGSFSEYLQLFSNSFSNYPPNENSV